MTEDELVEKVSRAIGESLRTARLTLESEGYHPEARAAIAVLRPLIRNEALEEAAKLADTGSDKYATAWRESGGDSYLEGCSDGIDDVAAAIRALKGKP